jgi:hypothetical protein
LSQPLSALTSDHVISILCKPLNEHELTLRAKVLDAKERTASNLLIFVIETSIEKWEKMPCLKISHVVIRGLFVQDVQRQQTALSDLRMLISIIVLIIKIQAYLDVRNNTSMTKSTFGLLTFAKAKALMMHSLSLWLFSGSFFKI